MTEDKLFIEQIISNSLYYKEVWIDFFCGFGGTTRGIEMTNANGEKIALTIACLNHDHKAIGSHKLSNPHCLHLEEDIRTASTNMLRYMVSEIRRRSFGAIKVKLWFSHDCTHHSGAKGGDSRDADSRSLPEELYRYMDDLQPDSVWIENVKEFLSWGPLIQKIKDGKPAFKIDRKTKKKKRWMIPDNSRKSEYYNKWVKDIISRGYSYDHRILNCADYGCPTIRKRLFIQFLKDEEIIWAKPTHSKNGTGGLEPWIAIKECLNLNDIGESIFAFKMKNGVKKPRIKSAKTFARLYNGCIKLLEPQFIQELEERKEARAVTAKRFISKFW